MARCPACQAMAFHDYRCTVCGYEEAPVYELPLEAIEDAEPLSLDALEPFAPEGQIADGVEPLDLGLMEEVGPLELETSELSEPVPMLEGFEGTMIEERARPRRKEPAQQKTSTPFIHQICPSCGAPVPQPNPAFCDACGHKLIAKRKVADEEEGEMKRCGECGTRNAPDRGICRNCGSRLPSQE